MNATLKNVLVITMKNAVRAILTNTGAWGIDPEHFNVVSVGGVKHILLLAASTIASTEAIYWAPRILKWAQSVPQA